MRSAYRILGILRYIIIAAAALALGVGMAFGYDEGYTACALLILLFIIVDAAVLILQRKLGIPIKYHENMFKFKKRK